MPNRSQQSSTGRLLICAIFPFAFYPGSARRSIGPFEEGSGRRPGWFKLSDQDEEPDQWFKLSDQDEEPDQAPLFQKSRQYSNQDWKDKLCRPFKRFGTKSYYFDLKNGSTYVAMELKRVKWPQGLYLKLYINQVWQIKQAVNSSRVAFEPVPAPEENSTGKAINFAASGRPSKLMNLSVDLLNDDVTIRTFVVKDYFGKEEIGIEFSLGSDQTFAFEGGSYYQSAKVKRAIAVLKDSRKETLDREHYDNSTTHDVDIIVTPALASAKAFLGAYFIPLPFTMAAYSIFHSSAIFLLPLSSLALPIALGFSGAVGLHALQTQLKAKRDAELSAAEKIAEVLWCLSTTTESCSPTSASKSCFVVCDRQMQPGVQTDYKVLVRPKLAEKNNLQCASDPDTKVFVLG